MEHAMEYDSTKTNIEFVSDLLKDSEYLILLNLMRSARDALRKEDELLAGTFQRAPNTIRELYQQHPATNEGLGYWLFETTLVYTIFKSWIPVAKTMWEGRYQDVPNLTADLVVHPDPNRPNTTWGFEAKWWTSMGKKSTNALLSDADKLLRWRGLSERWLLTFWISPSHARDTDVQEIREFCETIHHKPDRTFALDLAYLDYFPTHIARSNPQRTEAHFFGFCALRVRETT